LLVLISSPRDELTHINVLVQPNLYCLSTPEFIKAKAEITQQNHRENKMELFAELFSDWGGILSFGIVAFIVGMGVYIYKWISKNIAEESKKSC